MNWVTANHINPAVANMSLGGGVSTALDTAVRNSIAAGVTYAIAAGNSNQNANNSSPARVAEAITVGASTQTDARASFSNFGSVVDIFAPGAGILSAYRTSDTATATLSGTSMAAPHVAGVAARYPPDQSGGVTGDGQERDRECGHNQPSERPAVGHREPVAVLVERPDSSGGLMAATRLHR